MGKIIFPHLKVGKAKEKLSNLSEIRSDKVAETKARSSNVLTNTITTAAWHKQGPFLQPCKRRCRHASHVLQQVLRLLK